MNPLLSLLKKIKMQKNSFSIFFILIIFTCFASLKCQQSFDYSSSCPLENDPTQLIRCIQIDIGSLIALAQGATDLTAFCALAQRYMECINIYTIGCIGHNVIFLFTTIWINNITAIIIKQIFLKYKFKFFSSKYKKWIILLIE